MTVLRPTLPMRAGRRQREAVDVEPGTVRIAQHGIRRTAGHEIRPLARRRPSAAARGRDRSPGPGVNGTPDAHVKMPDSCQPAANPCATPVSDLPNGSSHVELQTKLWRMSKSESPLLQRMRIAVWRLETVVEVAAADRLRSLSPCDLPSV